MDAIEIAGTALNTHQAWLNAISNNIANVNTAKATSGNAFQAEYLQVSAVENNQGVQVDKVVHGSAAGKLVYDPTNAVADKDGYVRMPDIDLSEQMSTLIMAQRGYQANAAVVDRAKTSYEAALNIGKG
jgi:flagellar basal-body rod protein FlgC